MKTAILLIGFGGPTSLGEVRPFLASVLEGVKVPPARIEEVVCHYEAVGGVSPYNAITLRQKRALRQELQKRGFEIPVQVGFRHSKPSFSDVFSEFKRNHVENVIAFVLSPLRTYASFEKYQEKIAEARQKTNTASINLIYTKPFHANPLFVKAQAHRIEETLSRIESKDQSKAFFLFTAHSIPLAMSNKSGYAGQFHETSELIAKKLDLKNWGIAYQSRSGNPSDPWLLPDINEAVRKIDKSQFKNVVIIPAGFLCDNVEVIYDLDIAAKKTAQEAGLCYFRASTVMDHPQFIGMMADQLIAKLLELLDLVPNSKKYS